MNLKEWLISWLQAKEEFSIQKAKLKKGKNRFEFILLSKETGDQYFFLVPRLKEINLDELMDEAKNYHAWIVTLNTRENIETLLEHWGRASKNPNLAFCFVNLETKSQWSVYPYTHNLIADPSKLRQGLFSLAESANL